MLMTIEDRSQIEDREWTPEPGTGVRPSVYLAIALQKQSGSGKLPQGYIYTYTYKSLSKREALARAAKALERDHPGENRLHWREIT